MLKRDIKTFEPDKDVRLMLNKARRYGIKLGFLCNAALRAYLPTKGYGPQKQAKP